MTPVSTKKAGKDISGDWVDPKILGINFAFVRKNTFGRSFRDVGSVTDWGVFPLSENERICSQYDGCVVPFQE